MQKARIAREASIDTAQLLSPAGDEGIVPRGVSFGTTLPIVDEWPETQPEAALIKRHIAINPPMHRAYQTRLRIELLSALSAESNSGRQPRLFKEADQREQGSVSIHNV